MRLFRSKLNTEEKIKEATFELLAEKGFAKINMRDIAKRAQTAVGQLTYYYGTKEHLIVSVMEDVTNNFIIELEKYVNKKADKLQAISTFFEELFEKENNVFKVLIDFTAQSLWNNTYRLKMNSFFSKTSEIMENAYKEMGVNESEAKNAADLLMATFSGRAIQRALENADNLSICSRLKNKILERERKLFNAKPANSLL